MKRLCILILILGLAGAVRGHEWITVDGVFAPPEEITLKPGDTVNIAVFGDGETTSGQAFYLQVTGPATYDLSQVTCPWFPDGVGALDLGDGLIYMDFAIPYAPIMDLPREVLLDGIEIQCAGVGDVTLEFMNGAFEVLDTQMIRQVEPQWIVVDGDIAPPDEIWTEPGRTFDISIHGDGETLAGSEFYLQIDGPATYDLSNVTCPWNPDGFGALEVGDGLIFLDLAIPHTGGPPPLPSEIVMEGIKIHGEGEGTVTVTMTDGTFTPLDTQIFLQSYLAAHWRLDEGEGTVASDSVGANDGTIYGPNWTTGQISGALSFDGEDDYVDCEGNDSLNLGTGPISVSAWIRPESLGIDEARGIISKWQDEANRWYLHTFEDWVGFTAKADNTWVYRTWTDAFMEPGQWYHICFVGDGTEGKLYVNGADRAVTRLYLPASLDNDAPVMIGYNGNEAAPTHFDGTIDDVRLHRKALSETEIREYYRDNGGAYTFYIDANDGNDLNDGLTQQTAFATVETASGLCRDGDTIVLLPGVYSGPGNRDIYFLDKSVTIRSTEPDNRDIVAATIIDCDASELEPHRALHFESGDGAASIVEGLTIINGYAPDGYGGAIYGRVADLKIGNCIFRDNFASGDGGGICIYGDLHHTTHPKIENSTFVNNSANRGAGLFCGISGHLTGSLTVSNCFFVENSAFSSDPDGGGGASVWGWGSEDVLIQNSTFVRNSAARNGGGTYTICTFTEIFNCIFWDNLAPDGSQIGGYYHTMGSCGAFGLIHSSDVQGRWGGIDGLWNRNSDMISLNPQFADPCNGDYRLLPGSPCIDAGDNSVVRLGDTDLGGGERIVDGDCDGVATLDMGAYEFSPADVGDFDGECDVDAPDFNILGAAWRSTKDKTNYNDLCDISNPKDAKIDWLDVQILCQNWLLHW